MSQPTPFDLDQFRIPTLPVTPPPQRKTSQSRQRGYFLKGPILLPWLIRAMALPGKALHVGLVLWFLYGLKGSRCVTLSPSQFARFGLQRETARRGILHLEDAGLVTVERSGKRSPRVTLVAPSTSTGSSDSHRSEDLERSHAAPSGPRSSEKGVRS